MDEDYYTIYEVVKNEDGSQLVKLRLAYLGPDLNPVDDPIELNVLGFRNSAQTFSPTSSFDVISVNIFG